MKVTIGPYVNWVGPYQIAEKILFWKDEFDDSVHQFGKWLSENSKGNDSLLTKFCNWIHSKRKRKVKVHVHNYDVWSMDDTLALVIKPMLVKLKEQKHGIAWIDNADVPEHLQSPDNSYSSEKYDWFLDELIWAFGYWGSSPEESFEDYMSNVKRADKAFNLFGKYYRTLWD